MTKWSAVEALPRDKVMTDDQLLAWLREPVHPVLSEEVAHNTYLTMHPRLTFLKNVPANGVLFDIGAGDGNLRTFRDWIAYPRQDLRFVGASLEHGSNTRTYEEFLIGDLDKIDLKFDRLQPTAAFMSHFIEHLQDPAAFLKKLAATLPAGSRVYVEWPSTHSMYLPSRAVAAAAGFSMSTLNFFDDSTHVRTYPIAEVCGYLSEGGFQPIQCGMVDMPFLADQMKYYGITENNVYYLTVASWLKTLFSSYVVAVRL